MRSRVSTKQMLIAFGALIGLVLAFWAGRIFVTLGSVEREGDPVAAPQQVEQVSDSVRDVVREEIQEQDAVEDTLPDDLPDFEPPPVYELPSTENQNTVSPPLPDEMFEAILLIGADESGLRADAIILVLIADGEDPMLVSIPRDLYLENPCTQEYTKINANLNGCGDSVSGPELLSVAVAQFTGVEIDHFVVVDFEGFADAVDAVGGIDWCFEYAVRDVKADLDEPAGCRVIDGDTALAWARSRSTQILKDGEWQGVGASDFTRQEHQQELLFQLLRKVASFESVGALQQVATTAVANVTLSESLSISRLVGLAWSNRDIRPESVVTISLEMQPATTESGAWVLEPTKPFNDLLAEVYPAAYVPVALGP
ncbi:MAG: LCP family protein [Acidimicrobiia bacterium]|nr:MAG: LCP family protein [Acidimicrobiia bacterium]